MTERSHIYPNVLCATPFYESAPNPNVFCAMIFRLLSGQRERWWSPQGLDFPKFIFVLYVFISIFYKTVVNHWKASPHQTGIVSQP